MYGFMVILTDIRCSLLNRPSKSLWEVAFGSIVPVRHSQKPTFTTGIIASKLTL